MIILEEQENFLSKTLKLTPVITAIMLVVVLFVWFTIGIREVLSPTVLTIIIITILTPFQKENRTIRILVGAVLFLYIAWFISLIATALVPFLISVVLAFMFDPFVTGLQKKGFSRSKATMILMLILALILAIFLLIIVPALINEASSFISQIDVIKDKVKEWILSLQHLEDENVPPRLEWIKKILSDYQQVPPKAQEFIDSVLSEIEKSAPQITKKVSAFLANIFSSILQVVIGLLTLLIIPIFMFYILTAAPEIIEFGITLIPLRYKESVTSIVGEICKSLSNYIRGQLIVALAVGTLSAIALHILGIKYALLIGVIAGVTNIIPYLGPIMGATPAILLALFKPNPTLAVISVIIAFWLIQTLEGSIITPKILGESLELPPILIMLAIIVGGTLHGFTGMLLALPCVCVLKVLFDRWYKSKKITVKLKKKVPEKDSKKIPDEDNKASNSSTEEKEENSKEKP